jgi:hypothetical protein
MTLGTSFLLSGFKFCIPFPIKGVIIEKNVCITVPYLISGPLWWTFVFSSSIFTFVEKQLKIPPQSTICTAQIKSKFGEKYF